MVLHLYTLPGFDLSAFRQQTQIPESVLQRNSETRHSCHEDKEHFVAPAGLYLYIMNLLPLLLLASYSTAALMSHYLQTILELGLISSHQGCKGAESRVQEWRQGLLSIQVDWDRLDSVSEYTKQHGQFRIDSVIPDDYSIKRLKDYMQSAIQCQILILWNKSLSISLYTWYSESADLDHH